MVKQSIVRKRVSPTVIRKRLVDKEVVAVSPVHNIRAKQRIQNSMAEQLQEWKVGRILRR